MIRSFLALQGTASPFFRQLAHGLCVRGHRVRRVNFCGGDVAYSGDENVCDYSERPVFLADWYRQIVGEAGFSDVLLFGDCRAVHHPVHEVAQKFGVRVHVFEEGYLRPHWITMERHGVNGRSQMSRDPAWYLDQRKYIPAAAPGRSTGYNLYERARHDIAYRLANALHMHRFPHYESHRPKGGCHEYAGLAWRALHQRRYDKEAEAATRDLIEGKHQYYLFPLQLNSDSQIVNHSPFEGVCEAISIVLNSFARHAPENTYLVVKNHPLDTGLVGYRHFAQARATELGIEKRLRFIDAGHLPTLLEHSHGVVVVNSTVGLSAIHHGRPVIALGTAIYSMPGLTWQGRLSDFWTQAEPPSKLLYQSFVDSIMHHTQINGDFYTQSGIAMSVEGAITRLEAARD